MRVTRQFLSSTRSPALHMAKMVVATVAAWFLTGLVIHGQPPIFAAIAALLVVQPSVNQSLAKAVERSVGVIAGVVIATALSLLLGEDTLVVALAIVIAVLVAWAARMTAGTANQVAISAMLVVALGSSSPEYALDRILETLLGALIGFLVNLALVPPVALAPARAAVVRLGDELAASLDRLAAALTREQTAPSLTSLLLEARLMRPMADAAASAIAAASESLMLNPRGRRHRDDVERLRATLDRLTPVVTQTIGMTRAYNDHYDDALPAEPTLMEIADQLRRASHDVRLLVRPARSEPEPVTSEIPALTSPLVVAPPQRAHWIVIGSLMEDLRRIRDELVEAREA